jgi:endonuclease/exonuclease/phosphatase family metal-dependent hydrolase
MRFLIALCFAAVAAHPLRAEEGAKSLKVMTWNIRHGRGLDETIDLERIAAIIAAQKPDLVLLQEVDQGCARSGGVDQAQEIAKIAGLHHAFGKAMDHDGGGYGQAILSRFPLLDPKIHRLPGNGEPRIAFSATIESSVGTLTVASTHLTQESGKTQHAQSQVAAASLLESPHPVILAGDLNAKPDSQTVKVFTQAPWTLVPKAGSGLTFPASEPQVEIDYIILRGLRSQQPSTVLEEHLASDHRPVVVTVWPNE